MVRPSGTVVLTLDAGGVIVELRSIVPACDRFDADHDIEVLEVSRALAEEEAA
jgi:hypothetical protein